MKCKTTDMQTILTISDNHNDTTYELKRLTELEVMRKMIMHHYCEWDKIDEFVLLVRKLSSNDEIKSTMFKSDIVDSIPDDKIKYVYNLELDEFIFSGGSARIYVKDKINFNYVIKIETRQEYLEIEFGA